MNDKSHVGMGFYICPVTGQKHSEVVLLNTRVDRKTNQLEQTLGRDNFLGWVLSPENQKLADDGYIALVGIDPEKSLEHPMTPANVYRLGRHAHLRREAAERIFNQQFASDLNMVFVDGEVLDMLEASLK